MWDFESLIMEYTSDWRFTPNDFYHQSQPGQPEYPPSTTTYFENRARIAKPSRRHVSPRGSVKRKVNSVPALPVRTRSVIDSRPTFPQMQNEYARLPNRPISWHPISIDPQADFEFPSGGLRTGYLNAPFTAAEVNGVITPLSLPLMDEPQIHDITTPLNELSGNDFATYSYWNMLDASQAAYWTQENEKLSSDMKFYPRQDCYATDYNNMFNQFHTTKIATAPASPSFRPLQSDNNDAGLTQPSTPNAPEELVGMGLYDSPAEVQSLTLGHGLRSMFGTSGPIGKGLKLEDSFEPAETDLNDNDNEPEPEEGDDEDEVAEEQLPLQTYPVTCPEVSTDAQNFANQTFYFDQNYVLGNTPTFADPSYFLGGWQSSHYDPYGWI